MTRPRAELLLVAVTLMWAGTFAILKVTLDSVPPSLFVLLRFGVASVVAVALWPSALRLIRGRLLRRGLVLGTLFAAGFLLQTFGLTTTTATTSAFITGTNVAWVPFVNMFMGGRRLTMMHMLSVAMVVAGLWVFTSPNINGVHAGDLFTLASAMLWAVYMVFIDRWTKPEQATAEEVNALVVMQFLMAAAWASICMVMNGEALHVEVTWGLVAAVAYCGLVASVVTTWLQTRYQHHTHPVRVGIIFAIEPLAAAVIAVYTLHEPFSTSMAIGAAIMCVALVLPDVIQLLNGDKHKIRNT